MGQIDLPTLFAAMTPQSIYRLLLTDGQQASQYLRRSLRSLGGYNDAKFESHLFTFSQNQGQSPCDRVISHVTRNKVIMIWMQ